VNSMIEQVQATSKASPADEMEVLTFNLNDETFALEAIRVQEILDVLPETRVPGADRFAGSVINFRGRVIPLADLRLAFGMDAVTTTIDSRIVVIELEIRGEPTLIGLRTDKVNEVTTLSKANGEPPPSVGMRWRPDFIEGLFKREGEFIILPNLTAIFNQNDASTAAASRIIN